MTASCLFVCHFLILNFSLFFTLHVLICPQFPQFRRAGLFQPVAVSRQVKLHADAETDEHFYEITDPAAGSSGEYVTVTASSIADLHAHVLVRTRDSRSAQAAAIIARALGSLRHAALSNLVLGDKLTSEQSDLLCADSSFRNLQRQLRAYAVHGNYSLIGSELPVLLGAPDGSGSQLKFAGSIDCVLLHEDAPGSKTQLIIDFKSGAPPGHTNGSTQYSTLQNRVRYANRRTSIRDLPPFPSNSQLARDVLQVSLYSYALARDMQRMGQCAVPTVPLLMFGNPTFGKAADAVQRAFVMNLASHGLHMDDRVVEFLLAQAACSIDAVQEFTQLHGAPREVRHLVWGWPETRDRFARFPEVLQVDTVASTNKQGRPCVNLVGVDSFRHNIHVLQGHLANQKRTMFTWLLREALPFVVGAESLRATSIFISDDDRQVADAFEAAKNDGVFHKAAVKRLCAWHLSTCACN